MPKDKSKIPEKYKKFFDTKMIIILGIVGKILWDTFTTGAEVKYQKHFQETMQTSGVKMIIKSQISSAMDDANIWKKALANEHLSSFALEAANKAKEEISKQILLQDSSKVNLISTLGLGSGIRDEEIVPILVGLLKAIDNGDLIFKEDIEELIEEEVDDNIRTVRAGF